MLIDKNFKVSTLYMVEELKKNISKVRQTFWYTMLGLNVKICIITFSPISSNMLIKTVCFHLT